MQQKSVTLCLTWSHATILQVNFYRHDGIHLQQGPVPTGHFDADDLFISQNSIRLFLLGQWAAMPGSVASCRRCIRSPCVLELATPNQA
jgi:hypothetical protein